MSFGPAPSPFTQSLRAAKDRKKQRVKRWLTICGVLIVVTGVGSWFMWGGSPAANDATSGNASSAARQAPDEVSEADGKTPVTPEARMAVEYNDKKLKPGDSSYLPGSWATAKTFAMAQGSTLTGYRFRQWDPIWSTRLSGAICSTTRHVTVDGRTAVVAQSGRGGKANAKSACNLLVVFNVNTGKKMWEVTLPHSDNAYATNMNVTLTRGVAVTAWGSGSAAYDLRQGKKLWETPGREACNDSGFAGGRDLLALQTCGSPDDDTSYRVQKIDRHTGKPEWTYQVSRGVGATYLVSSNPPVIAVAAGADTVTDLIVLDAHGKHRSTMALGVDRYVTDCGGSLFGTVESCHSVIVGSRQVFVAGKASIDALFSDRPANSITAFDLHSGKPLRKLKSKARRAMYPVQISGDRLLAFRASDDNRAPSAVVSIDPKTGTERPFLLFEMPSDMAALGEPESLDMSVSNGRVFFAFKEIHAPDKADESGLIPGVVGYESAG
ncbi:PQQ-binding-like beta-propeller repeat protein [Streptomyces sp. NPDC059904]|uniref:outer membrane protein assembly factor BamB family protein n=1 Tax=unclassified Streptomyces TaxID=2593676 RepID=UPI003663294C